MKGHSLIQLVGHTFMQVSNSPVSVVFHFFLSSLLVKSFFSLFVFNYEIFPDFMIPVFPLLLKIEEN